MSATIEELHSDHSDRDDGGANLDKIQSRAERKARKALLGMGLKRVAGINRVTLKRAKTVLLVVAQPDVYKSTTSDCYIVFGEAKQVDDPNASGAFASQLGQEAAAGEADDDEDDDDVPDLEAVDEPEAEVDETGIEPRDIDVIMSQVGCDRQKAVKALKENGGDVVNAIMSASS